MNDSSTGGYLLPGPTPAPLEGQALLQFLTTWVSGVSGLPGRLVRPSWQTEPPNIPPADTCWCAVAIQSRPSDDFAWVDWNSADSNYQFWRQETLQILASFYDTGFTGQADQYAAQFRDGVQVPQNREALTLQNFGVARTGDLLTVPSLLKIRWLYRVDLDVVLRRQITRVYPVDTFAGAEGNIYTDGGLPPEPFTVSEE